MYIWTFKYTLIQFSLIEVNRSYAVFNSSLEINFSSQVKKAESTSLSSLFVSQDEWISLLLPLIEQGIKLLPWETVCKCVHSWHAKINECSGSSAQSSLTQLIFVHLRPLNERVKWAWINQRGFRRDVNHSYSRRASSCPATHGSSVCISGEELAPSLSVQLLLIIQLDIKEIHQHSNYAVMMKTARSLREDTAAPPTQRLLPSLVFYSG